MIYLFLAFLSLAPLVHCMTSPDGCPELDGPTRSMLDILSSCAVTLVICVWNAVHTNIIQSEAMPPLLLKVMCSLLAFFLPEVLAGIAAREWWNACDKVERFREKGYGWSMTHSFFAEMGGFVYRNENGKLDVLDSLKFLELCEANRIANPIITTKEIKDKSKSDLLGKAIFACHLLWFMLQVVVRWSGDLAITLVELDTLSITVVSLFVILLWLDKPLSPQCPHIFYYSDVELYPRTPAVLSEAWKPEPGLLCGMIAWCRCSRKDRSTRDEEVISLVGKDEKNPRSKGGQLVDDISEKVTIYRVALVSTWLMLGGLHLTAWNFEFPTEKEKVMWRIASVVLTGSSLPTVGLSIMAKLFSQRKWRRAELAASAIGGFTALLCIASRALLVLLMLRSLRALPCSAYQTIAWTIYIPHL